MDVLQETEAELEQKARAQAQAIAEAEALMRLTRGQLLLRAVVHSLNLSDDAAPPPKEVPPPGRELLIWQLRSVRDLAAEGLPLAYRILREPAFIATVPEGRDCPIASHQAQRTWNEAVREWSKQGDAAGEAWVKCDRKLHLRRRGDIVQFVVVFKDLVARMDTKAQKVAPTRSEGSRVVAEAQAAQLLQLFPQLSVADLAEGLRVPPRQLFAAYEKRRTPDAYIANQPLRMRLEEINATGGKAKPREVSRAEEVGKGFASWLSSVMKANSR